MVEKVQKAIKDLGYVPSLSAKSLAGRGSNLIGMSRLLQERAAGYRRALEEAG